MLPRLPRLAALLLAGAAACRPTPDAVRYSELPTDPPPGPPGGAEVVCANETRPARPVRPGESFEVPIELRDAPRFFVSACDEDRRPATLTVTVRAGGETRSGRLELDGPGWRHGELDLGPLAGKLGTVRVAVGPSRRWHKRRPRPVWISDAYVRQRVPAAERRRDEPAPGRRILLISIDTLRTDAIAALAPGGRPREPIFPTPALDRFVADGEVFSPTYAGASWTKPSHGALLTGLLPSANGTLAMGAIHPEIPTLAERLHRAGLATGGLVYDCTWLNPKFGFDRGFDDYRSVRWQTARLGRATADWIASHRDRPFFFFLHTFEVHSDFHRLPYEGSHVTTGLLERLFGVPKYGCRDGECGSGFLIALHDGTVHPIPEDPAILRYLYAAGVAATDAGLGQLFDDLRAMGIYDDLTIVLTADHGEMLLEHGDTLHGRHWEQVVRVPLVVKWPRGERAGRRTARLTSALDVVPTLLDLAGAPAAELPGRDLRSPRSGPVFSDSGWTVVRDGRWKAAVGMPDGDVLFDLAADPGEAHDLKDVHPDVFAALRHRVEARRAEGERRRERLAAGAGDREAPELTPEERERLRALGYLR